MDLLSRNLARIALLWLKLGNRILGYHPRTLKEDEAGWQEVYLGAAPWRERAYRFCVREAASFALSALRARRAAEARIDR